MLPLLLIRAVHLGQTSAFDHGISVHVAQMYALHHVSRTCDMDQIALRKLDDRYLTPPDPVADARTVCITHTILYTGTVHIPS